MAIEDGQVTRMAFELASSIQTIPSRKTLNSTAYSKCISLSRRVSSGIRTRTYDMLWPGIRIGILNTRLPQPPILRLSHLWKEKS
ncbi:hypothetical protein TNCV_1692951 [Trichonephila clavipes]|nr:hypothetical protein TNCV_1692951 [Trichonephila clavipes]